MPDDGVRIVALGDRAPAPRLLAQIEAIFFAASGRAFEPGPEREAFRARWLGRYMQGGQGGTDVVLLALSGDSVVAGYLVGALHDPAAQDRFADIGYFRADFRELCRRFPAHLHVNLAPVFRGKGLGAGLIGAFAAHASAAGAAGMHVVTGKAARNVSFYTRCGFTERGTTVWNGGEVAFLARELAAPD